MMRVVHSNDDWRRDDDASTPTVRRARSPLVWRRLASQHCRQFYCASACLFGVFIVVLPLATDIILHL
jgi:hypothetical protein